MLQIALCNASKLTARLGGVFCDDAQIVGFNLYQRGTKRDLSVFDKEAQDTLVSEDKFIGCVKFFSAEEAPEEATFVTSATGDRYKSTPGAERWSFNFAKGTCFHRQLANLDSSENYEVGFVDIKGRELAKQNKDGTVSGFKVNLFVGNRKIKTGAETLTSTIMVDLLAEEVEDWNKNAVFIESSEFSYKDLNPVAELTIAIPNLVATATSTTVKVTSACSDVQISGLTTAANWKMEEDGVLKTITAVTSVNGSYTFTHPALVATKKVRFLIDVAGYPVYVLDSNYYAGASELEIVA